MKSLILLTLVLLLACVSGTALAQGDPADIDGTYSFDPPPSVDPEKSTLSEDETSKTPPAQKSAKPKLKRSVDETRGISLFLESAIIGGGAGLCGCTGLAGGIVLIQALNDRRGIDKRQVLWTFGSFITASVVISVLLVGGLGIFAAAAVSNPDASFVAGPALIIASFGSGFVSGGAAGLAWYLTDPDKKTKDRAVAEIFTPAPPNLAMAF